MNVLIDTNVMLSAALRDKLPSRVVLYVAARDDCRWLVAGGYFERATELLAEKGRETMPVGPFYDLTISDGGQSPIYHAPIGWGRDTIVRLKAIQSRLDGPLAKAIDRMIEAVSRSSDVKDAPGQIKHEPSRSPETVDRSRIFI